MFPILVLALIAVTGLLAAALIARRRAAVRTWNDELDTAFARDEDVPSLQRVMLAPSYAPRHRLAVPEAAEAAETV